MFFNQSVEKNNPQKGLQDQKQQQQQQRLQRLQLLQQQQRQQLQQLQQQRQQLPQLGQQLGQQQQQQQQRQQRQQLQQQQQQQQQPQQRQQLSQSQQQVTQLRQQLQQIQQQIPQQQQNYPDEHIFRNKVDLLLFQQECVFQFFLTTQFLLIRLYDLGNNEVFEKKLINQNYTALNLNQILKRTKLAPTNFFQFDPNNQQYIYIFELNKIILTQIDFPIEELLNLKINRLSKRFDEFEQKQQRKNQQYEESIDRLLNAVFQNKGNNTLIRRNKLYQQEQVQMQKGVEEKVDETKFLPKEVLELYQWDTSKECTSVVFSDQDRTVTSTKGNFWRGIRGKAVVDYGVTSFRIQINKLCGSNQHNGIMIGVVDALHTGTNFESEKGYMLNSNNGSFYHNNKRQHELCFPLNDRDIVTLTIDLNNRSVSFLVNGRESGSIQGIPSRVRLAIDLLFNKNSATILLD
ncbi:squamosa promoter-binding-like protein [Anaeramoeba flamelloides]|uniref:Squamosa promoter-binding-like protein n=1 Tax=Anaeramoeba flamelloides TaxID=1746091 RepID=A0AAV7ZMI6_9EUKA|nr:squamosa promoter-binding-like protein [Anaeramoeba flamelloides]